MTEQPAAPDQTPDQDPAAPGGDAGGLPPFIPHPAGFMPTPAAWAINRWPMQTPTGVQHAVVVTLYYANGSQSFLCSKDQANQIGRAFIEEAAKCPSLTIATNLHLPPVGDMNRFRPGGN